jgi:hypothetical protein
VTNTVALARLATVAGAGEVIGGGGGGSAYDNLIMADSPFGYWPLADSPDDMTGTFPGVVSGGVTFGAPGIGDGAAAATFDGSGAVSIPGPTIQPPITFEAWVRLSAGGYNAVITRTSGNLGTPYDWHSHQFFVGQTAHAFTTGMIVDTWTYLAVTHDTDGTLTRYFNGNREGSDVDPAGPDIHQPLALVLGNRDDRVTGLNGLMAKAAAYDHVLSAAQIAAHYGAG